MAAIPKQGENNVVHQDENWRQRVNSERHASNSYNENWGFLLPGGQKSRLSEKTDAELRTMQSQQAPARKYMEHRNASRRSTGQMVLDGDNKTVKQISRPGSMSERELTLSAAEAYALQPQRIQGCGASICTPGVDPTQKYTYPQTQQQNVGWNARESLEFFGVSQHGRTPHAERAIYDLN